MRKVCHITSAHNRYDVRILEKQCKSLAKNGYETFLIVNDKEKDENKSGVNIISTGFLPKSRMDRILNSRKAIYRKALQVDAQIYHLHDPELLPLVRLLKKEGKSIIFDSHEDVPSQLAEKKWIPKLFRKTISIVYAQYEKKIFPQLDGLISVTPHITERLSKLNNNTVEITNYPIVKPKTGKSSQKERFICFAGGVSPQWMHDNIIAALEKIGDIKYYLCGFGNKDYLKQLKSQKGWQKVEYLGQISHEEVGNIYDKCQIGMALLSYGNNVGGKTGTIGNTKLFEIMLAGLPVICTDFILWKQIVDEYQCGICVQPDNIDAIESSIRYLFDNPDVAQLMGENGRKAVLERFNWGMEERKLLQLYEEILDKKN